MSFKALGLTESLLKAVEKKGYSKPSPIQEKAIPHILQKKDVLASAQTGTGKTAGFILPILQNLSEREIKGKKPIRALVLTPTRELAAQILEETRAYSEFIGLHSMVIFGGVNQNPQVNKLRRGVDILVATPGRLLDLEGQRELSLSNVEVLVLDEADRMLDMGFARDINRIMGLLPKRRQNLLFSATFSKEIKKLASGILHNPVMVEAERQNSTAERVEQRIIKVDKGNKATLLIKLITEGNWSQVLVFTRTKHGANKLSQRLDKKKISSAAIHGNKSQGARTRALAGFKEGNIRVLVATDIAARGLDIPLLPHVINYELPNIPEDYVHRIGRTGRAGASGEALSLVSVDEYDYLRSIEKLLGEKLPSEVEPGFEPVDTLDDVLKKQAENKQKYGRRPRGNSNSGSKGGDNRRSGNRNNSGKGNRR